MSYKEADRVGLIRAVVEKRMRQREAAKRLGIGVRQVKRLVRRYRSDGPAGLVSGHRGKRPNNAIGEGVRRGVLALVRKRYADFGPTLACEKLVEVHGHRLSAETLRQWMMAEGLWRSKARRAVRVHPRRSRRACVGDLVQIDGSPHDWFEGRGPLCTLIVYVDDATTRLMAAGFFPAETTDAYMETTRAHLAACGRPVAYLLGPVRCVPGQQEGQGERVDAVRAGAQDAGHRLDPRGQPAGEGARGTGEPHASGSAGEGDAAARGSTAWRRATRTCRSSWRTSTGVSRWRRGIRRTRTGRCCTRPGSWT